VKRDKIAVLIPHFGRGGAELFAIEMTQLLNTRFDMTVFCSTKGENDYDTTSLAVEYIGDRLYNPEALCLILKQNSFRLIWSHMSWDNYHVKCLPLFKQQGIKVVLTEHSSFWYPYFCEGIGIWDDATNIKLTAMATFSMLDAIVCVSKDSHQVYSKFISNSHYIPNYPNSIYTNSSRKSIQYDRSIQTAIGHVSSFSKPVKRVDLLYKAFDFSLNFHEDSKLHIAGRINWHRDYAYRKSCTNLKADSIVLHGEISGVKSLYEKMDIFSLTSQLEGMPTVVLEASAMSIPVISFDIPGIEELIRDGSTGYIVKFPDYKEMGRVLGGLAKNKSKIRTMGENARHYITEGFSAKKSATMYSELLIGILAKEPLDYNSEPEIPFWELSQIDFRRQRIISQIDPHNITKMKPDALPADWRLTPLVSFLIPCFNCKNTIHRAINSLLRNYSFEWEIIILNDGSPDDNFDDLLKNHSHRKQIRLVSHPENRGLYEARSSLAKAANGYFLVFVDADDTLAAEMLESYINYAMLTGADIVDGGLNEIQEGQPEFTWSPDTSFLSKSQTLNNLEARTSFFLNKIKQSCCGKIYKKDIFLKTLDVNLPFSKINTCEDLVRNTLIFSAGATYSALSLYPFYNYIRSEQSMSKHNPNLRVVLDKIRSISNLYIWSIQHTKPVITNYESDLMLLRLYNDSVWIVKQYVEQMYLENNLSLEEIFKDVFNDVTAITESEGPHGSVVNAKASSSSNRRSIAIPERSISNSVELLKLAVRRLLDVVILNISTDMENRISRLDASATSKFDTIFSAFDQVRLK
jgi:glycosyltransferase involved in cell wall biosynthesis